MKITNINKILIIALILCVSACGGGSSNSGGGSAPPPVVSNDGVYSGTIDITFSAQGILSETDTFGIVITISGNNVSITDGDFVATGSIAADQSYTATTMGYSGSVDGIDCTGEFTFAGSVNAGVSQGNMFSVVFCSDGDIDVAFTLEGPYTARRGNSKALNTDIMQNIKTLF